MISTIKILDTPVTFTYDLERGQVGNFNQEDIPGQIIDLAWEEELYSEAVNDVIKRALGFMHDEIWKEINELKKSVLYDKAINDFDEGLEI